MKNGSPIPSPSSLTMKRSTPFYLALSIILGVVNTVLFQWIGFNVSLYALNLKMLVVAQLASLLLIALSRSSCKRLVLFQSAFFFGTLSCYSVLQSTLPALDRGIAMIFVGQMGIMILNLALWCLALRLHHHRSQ
jgi:hypothetical protein